MNAKKKKRKREEEEQTDWEKESFAFSPKVRQVLQLVFGLRSFRPQQLTVINASLSSVDCFAVASLLQFVVMCLVLYPESIY